MRKVLYICLVCLFIALPVDAKRLHPEKWYQGIWCKAQGGETEVVLPDRTRCDCLTESHAIEFDFMSKWKEPITQALHYAMQTGKRAGIVLILEKESDLKYWHRLKAIIARHKLPIDMWSVNWRIGKP